MKKQFRALVVVGFLFTLGAQAGEYKESYSCGTLLSAFDSNGKFGPVAFFSAAVVEYRTGLDTKQDFFTESNGSKLTARIFTGAQADFNYRGKISIERDSKVIYESLEIAGDFLHSGQFDNYQITFGCNKGLVLLQ